jgi:3-methyl-2-oxobutanoate hydroxymethyltransferase
MTQNNTSPIRVPHILSRKPSRDSKQKLISAVTAYDFTSARLVDESGIDIILVGDSLACVIQGYDNTLPVTLDEMIYHAKCVTKATKRALVVGDLPFLSYQTSIEDAIRSAGRMIKEAGVSAIKLEGGIAFIDTIKRLVQFDIPVVGHVGLTPQSFHRMGGHKIQGRKDDSKKNVFSNGSYQKILADAKALDDAGVFAIVIEGVPEGLAKEITDSVRVPTIGIGAGRYCDGQILVFHDLLGLEDRHQAKFVKRYACLANDIRGAITNFKHEVEQGIFPEIDQIFDPISVSQKKVKPNLKLMRG